MADERRVFFWSARTLRCDVWVRDPDGEWDLDRTEDCLVVDSMRCVVAIPPYDRLIPVLLTRHCAEEVAGG